MILSPLITALICIATFFGFASVTFFFIWRKIKEANMLMIYMAETQTLINSPTPLIVWLGEAIAYMHKWQLDKLPPEVLSRLKLEIFIHLLPPIKDGEWVEKNKLTAEIRKCTQGIIATERFFDFFTTKETAGPEHHLMKTLNFYVDDYVAKNRYSYQLLGNFIKIDIDRFVAKNKKKEAWTWCKETSKQYQRDIRNLIESFNFFRKTGYDLIDDKGLNFLQEAHDTILLFHVGVHNSENMLSLLYDKSLIPLKKEEESVEA